MLWRQSRSEWGVCVGRRLGEGGDRKEGISAIHCWLRVCRSDCSNVLLHIFAQEHSEALPLPRAQKTLPRVTLPVSWRRTWKLTSQQQGRLEEKPAVAEQHRSFPNALQIYLWFWIPKWFLSIKSLSYTFQPLKFWLYLALSQWICFLTICHFGWLFKDLCISMKQSTYTYCTYLKYSFTFVCLYP